MPLSRFDLDHAARTLEADGWRVLGRTTRQSTGVKTHYLTLAKDGAAGSLVVFRCDTASIAAAVEKGMVGQAHVAVTRQGNDLASVTLVDSKGNTTPEMLLRLVIR